MFKSVILCVKYIPFHEVRQILLHFVTSTSALPVASTLLPLPHTPFMTLVRFSVEILVCFHCPNIEGSKFRCFIGLF